jgi:hypothetical protein
MKAGIADVVSGNNSVVRHGKVIVKGFAATRGFDVASGWGTIRANIFVPSLVAATRAQHQDRAVRLRAAAALSRLEHGVLLTSAVIGTGSTARMSDGGFLPLHPVSLLIDNHLIKVLHASAGGSVSYVIDPNVLGLSPGRHTLTLTSMLLTAATSFRTT